MLGSFLLPFRHLSLDHPWIDPVATRLGPLRLASPRARLDTTPRTSAGVELSHSGSRHFRIWKHPVNDSRSGSRPTVAAASNISDRITKWPSDSA